MRALIIGSGLIGLRHAANLRRLRPGSDLVFWRHSAAAPPLDLTGDLLGAREVHDATAAFAGRPRLAVVACPTSRHVEFARLCLDREIPVFLEKPLSMTRDGVATLQSRSEGGAVMVGYVLRFAPVYRAARKAIRAGLIGKPLSSCLSVGQYLPQWRPDRDYRQIMSGRRELGGGVLFELSHELDMARWLFGDPVSVVAMAGRASDLEIDVADVADVLIRFAAGAYCNVHLDMLDRVAARTCRVVGERGTLTVDFGENVVWLGGMNGESPRALFGPAHVDRNDMYLEEMGHFLDCAETGISPLVPVADAARTLDLVLAAAESARGGVEVRL